MPTPNYGFNTPPQSTRISSIPYEIGLLAEQIDAAILSLSAGAGAGTYPAPAQIIDTANLNFLTAPGKWARYTTPPATWAGQNYPAQVRGFLEVYATTPGLTVAGRSMAQMYVSAVDTYTAPRVWVRTGYVPAVGTYSWGAWREVTTDPRQPAHARFTLSGALPTSDTTVPLPGNFSAVAAGVNNNSFASAGGADITLQPGSYSLNYFVNCANPMGLQPYLGLHNASGAQLFSTSLVPNAWDGSFTHPALYVSAATTYRFYVRQNSGASRNVTALVDIEKIA